MEHEVEDLKRDQIIDKREYDKMKAELENAKIAGNPDDIEKLKKDCDFKIMKVKVEYGKKEANYEK